jgi:type II secretory pathway component PulC
MIGLPLLVALLLPPADLTAIGIVSSDRPEGSVALLRSSGRTRIVRVGESAFGGRVTAIGQGVISMEFASDRVDLRLATATTSNPRPAPVRRQDEGPAGAATPAEDPTTPARQMSRAEVQRRLSSEIPRILAETAVSPVTQDGHVIGLAVNRIPDGSLLADAGLRPGDVLTRINDVPVDGLPTLIGLWSRLQNESDLRAVVLRGGRPVLLSVNLR